MRPGDAAGQPKGPFAPMPPVTTQPVADRRDAMADGRMVGPFVGPAAAIEPDAQVAAAPTASATPLPPDEDIVWAEDSDEGVVEPAFEADVSETEASLAALSKAATTTAQGDEDFPLDAFIIPEHSRRLPTGIEAGASAKPAAPGSAPVKELADRLEKLSHRMRVDDADAIVARLASGDKLDAMLAGLLAGYLGTK